MAEVSNEISVAFGALKTKTTGGIYRLDEEQYLVFTDIELPEYFRADFGLSETGDTISMVGTENRVLIPDELLLSPGLVHAWVWANTGTYGGKTIYHVKIPVKARGNRGDIDPVPAEQQQIDSLINALNDGVETAGDAANKSEAAVTHYPKIVDGYWYVWDTENKEWVNTRVRAEGEGTGIDRIEKTGTQGLVDTYTIYYTDGTTHTYTVTNGADGQDGRDGQDGADGVSPTVTIDQITGGHSVTITDAQHPSGQSFNVLDGVDGDDGEDGVSPTVAISSVTGGHSVTITDASHPTGQTFNVMDGQDAVIDATLTHQGEAADAKAAGDAVSELRNTLSHNCDRHKCRSQTRLNKLRRLS